MRIELAKSFAKTRFDFVIDLPILADIESING
jgi:hypothetical protein